MYLQNGWSAPMNLQSNVSCDSIVIKNFITIMMTANVFPYIFLYISLYLFTFKITTVRTNFEVKDCHTLT